MSVLDVIPAIVRVAIVFFLVLLAIRKKLSRGNAFVLGGIFLALLFRMAPAAAAAAILRAALDVKTVFLSVIVVLILVLSNSMEAAAHIFFMQSLHIFDVIRRG